MKSNQSSTTKYMASVKIAEAFSVIDPSTGFKEEYGNLKHGPNGK